MIGTIKFDEDERAKYILTMQNHVAFARKFFGDDVESPYHSILSIIQPPNDIRGIVKSIANNHKTASMICKLYADRGDKYMDIETQNIIVAIWYASLQFMMRYEQ